MRTIKTYFKGAPFYNAFIRHWDTGDSQSLIFGWPGIGDWNRVASLEIEAKVRIHPAAVPIPAEGRAGDGHRALERTGR